VGMTPDQLLPQEYAAQWRELYARALREGAFVTEYLTSAKTHVLLLSINCLKMGGEYSGYRYLEGTSPNANRRKKPCRKTMRPSGNSKKDSRG